MHKAGFLTDGVICYLSFVSRVPNYTSDPLEHFRLKYSGTLNFTTLQPHNDKQQFGFSPLRQNPVFRELLTD